METVLKNQNIILFCFENNESLKYYISIEKKEMPCPLYNDVTN